MSGGMLYCALTENTVEVGKRYKEALAEFRAEKRAKERREQGKM